MESRSLNSRIADKYHRHRRSARRDGRWNGSPTESPAHGRRQIVTVEHADKVTAAVSSRSIARTVDIHVSERQRDTVVWNSKRRVHNQTAKHACNDIY